MYWKDQLSAKPVIDTVSKQYDVTPSIKVSMWTKGLPLSTDSPGGGVATGGGAGVRRDP